MECSLCYIIENELCGLLGDLDLPRYTFDIFITDFRHDNGDENHMCSPFTFGNMRRLSFQLDFSIMQPPFAFLAHCITLFMPHCHSFMPLLFLILTHSTMFTYIYNAPHTSIILSATTANGVIERVPTTRPKLSSRIYKSHTSSVFTVGK